MKRAAREALRARIRAIETGAGRGAAARDLPDEVVSLGVSAIDRALPWGGLPRRALHALTAAGGAGGAATGFAAVLVGGFCGAGGEALWCSRRADLYAPGLAALGVDAARLLAVHAARAEDVLWTLEEALGCGRFAAVLGEAATGPIASRRLQLAARTHGSTCLLLDLEGARPLAPSAAATCWRVAPAPGARGPGGGPAAPRWRLELARCRGAPAPRNWTVEWRHETRDLAVAAPLADRPSPRALPAA